MLGVERAPPEWLSTLEREHYAERPDALLDFANQTLAEMPLYRRLGYPRRVAALAELPILERSTLRTARPSELVGDAVALSAALAHGGLTRLTTSGATDRLTVFATPDDGDLMPPLHPLLMGVDPSVGEWVTLLTSPICAGTTCELTSADGLTVLPPTRDVFAEPPAYVREVVTRLAAAPSSFLLTNPIVLGQVLHRARSLGLEVSFRGATLSSYQRLPQRVRAAIGAALGCVVGEQYGASELAGSIVANSCRAGALHVWSTRAHVEIVDERGAPVAPGELGSVLVTNLGARGTRLLRYRLGDLGRLHRGPCACGLRSPAHLRIEGRARDAWRIEGRWITEAVVDERMAHVDGARLYQLTLGHDGAARLVIVPEEGATPRLDDARAALADLLPGALEVLVADEIHGSEGEKYPLLRNRRGHA